MVFGVFTVFVFDCMMLMIVTFPLFANLANDDACCRRFKIFLKVCSLEKSGAPAETRGESTAVQSGFIWHQFLLSRRRLQRSVYINRNSKALATP